MFALANPVDSGYSVRWPFYGNSFNSRYYDSVQEVLADIQLMWESAVSQDLRIHPKDFKVRIKKLEYEQPKTLM